MLIDRNLKKMCANETSKSLKSAYNVRYQIFLRPPLLIAFAINFDERLPCLPLEESMCVRVGGLRADSACVCACVHVGGLGAHRVRIQTRGRLGTSRVPKGGPNRACMRPDRQPGTRLRV